MKKILVLISALAFGITFAQAQMTGPGDGTGSGDGPNANNGGMWPYIAENAEGEILDAYNLVTTLRTDLRTSREEWLAENDSLEGWFESEAANIELLRTNVDVLRDWYRETRPDRPDPVMTGEMVQRRERFQQNSDGIKQTRERLRAMEQSDPDNPECEQLRQQLGNLLGERKQIIRNQRQGEGGSGGDGPGQRGG